MKRKILKYGIIPDTNIRFKIGDVIEVPNYSNDENLDSLFGRITRIEDTILDIRGYYCIYVNGEDTYYRSNEVIRWYRKNRKGILIPYCDEKSLDKIWQENHKNYEPDPILNKIQKDIKKAIDESLKNSKTEKEK